MTGTPHSSAEVTHRRQVLQGVAGTAALAATAGTASAQDNEDEDGPSFGVTAPGAEAAMAGAEAARYVVGRIEDIGLFSGPGVDEDEYLDLDARETHLDLYGDATEMGYYDDQVLTQVENNLDLAENALYADAKLAALEVHHDGGDLEEATQAAHEAIQDVLVSTQQNVAEHWTVQVQKIGRMVDGVEATEHLAISDVFWWYHPGNDRDTEATDVSTDATSWTLLDGSSYEGTDLQVYFTNDAGNERVDDLELGSSGRELRVQPVDSGEQITVLAEDRFRDAAARIPELAEETIDEIEAFLEAVYDDLDDEEYDPTDFVSGTDLAGYAAESPNDYMAAAADLAALGVPLADHTLSIELPEADDGAGVLYEGALAVTAEDVELEVGELYDPAELPGTVYMANNYLDEEADEIRGAKTILEQPFRIDEAVDPETGEEHSTVDFSGRNQQTTDHDVDALLDELEALAEAEQEVKEERTEIVIGGGGLFDDLDFGLAGAFLPVALLLIVATIVWNLIPWT